MEPRDTSSNTDEGIGRVTSVEEIIGALASRGCSDLTLSIDLATCSDSLRVGGRFCDVHRGWLYDGTQIAIKSLRVYARVRVDSDSQEILTRAARELYHWSKLKHPNILSLMGLAIFRGYMSMVSEWVENGSLMSYLKLNPDANRIKLCMDVCAGLCYIHANGMVHGDLKAANIVVSLSGTAMIADFGNTQLKILSIKLTNTGARTFSIRWAAPELLSQIVYDVPQPSREADVYAYGITVLETLTGRVPYEELDDRDVLFSVTVDQRSPLRPDNGICDGLWDILISCWAWEPSERPGITTISDRLCALSTSSTSETLSVTQPCETAELAKMSAPTPNPGWSGEMGGSGLLPQLLDVNTTLERKGEFKSECGADGELFPLNREEGESKLIDDGIREVRFMELQDSDGIDLLTMLSPELALYILSQLDLDSIIASLAVSHAWHRLASDDMVWQALFYRQPGWFVNLPRRRAQILAAHAATATQLTPSQSQPRSPSLLSSLSLTSSRRAPADPHPQPTSNQDQFSSTHEDSLNWPDLYRQRHRIARKWDFGTPLSTKLSGHLGSVYCLEFDTAADTIVTGSLDNSIKIWSVSSGEVRETLVAHEGSVLCLKVDFAREFMCSGSSDRTIRVWERNSTGMWEVKAVLSGHAGGVLDLRMDDRWIVSCTKGTRVRVWDRQTLQLHRVLRGHTGRVNAVGLQGSHVVSASADGTMILWDIESGSRVRMFSGHDRPFACVEFKGDTIISGSDCGINVWSVSSGECVVAFLGGDKNRVDALAYDATTGLLVSVGYGRGIKVWEVRERTLVREFRDVHDSYILAVKFDATRIVSASDDQNILVLDFAYDSDGSLFV